MKLLIIDSINLKVAISQVDFYINKNNLVEKLGYIYRPDATGNEMGVAIEYSLFDLQPNFDPQDFSEKKYFNVINQKVIPADQYKTYRVHHNLFQEMTNYMIRKFNRQSGISKRMTEYMSLNKVRSRFVFFVIWLALLVCNRPLFAQDSSIPRNFKISRSGEEAIPTLSGHSLSLDAIVINTPYDVFPWYAMYSRRISGGV